MIMIIRLMCGGKLGAEDPVGHSSTKLETCRKIGRSGQSGTR